MNERYGTGGTGRRAGDQFGGGPLRLWAGVLTLAGAVLLSGCDLNISGGPGEFVPRFTFTVNVQNDGTGSGTVEVTMPGGTITEECPAVLGPGEECAVVATAAAAMDRAEVSVAAAAGSEFGGWLEGPCDTDDDEICVIEDQSGDFDITHNLTLRFDAL